MEGALACKNCHKTCEGSSRSGLFRHIKVKKVCRKSYTNEEVAEIEQMTAQALKSKKKKYMSSYCLKHKKEKKEYNQKNYLHNKDLIKYQRRNCYEKKKEVQQIQDANKSQNQFCKFCKRSF